MKTLTTLEIVKQLIGNIKPVGDSNLDKQRLSNLKELCELVNDLVALIDNVDYDNRNAHEHSIKEMREYASNFLTKTLGIK